MRKTIERQIAKIEAMVNAQQAAATPTVPPLDATLFELLVSMEQAYVDRFLEQLETISEQSVYDPWPIVDCYEQYDKLGEYPPLLVGVLKMAREVETTVRCTHPTPCAMPPAICEIIEARGHEIYKTGRKIPVPDGHVKRRVPQLVWLTGEIHCVDCKYPIPHLSPFPLPFSPLVRENHTVEALPLCECPVCGGALFHQFR